jgi:hypothetical protein
MDGHHGALLPAPSQTAIRQHVARQVYVVKTRDFFFYYTLAILRHDTSSTHRKHAVPMCLWVTSAGSTESIILSAGGAESMMLSARTESMDPLSAGADSIILLAPPTESMILSALFGCVIMLTAAATKNQQSAILMIVDLQLWSTAPQRRCQLVGR